MFDIYFGVPEIRDFWIELNDKISNGTASKIEIKLYKKLVKTFKLLQDNPHLITTSAHMKRLFYQAPQSNEIEAFASIFNF